MAPTSEKHLYPYQCEGDDCPFCFLDAEVERLQRSATYNAEALSKADMALVRAAEELAEFEKTQATMRHQMRSLEKTILRLEEHGATEANRIVELTAEVSRMSERLQKEARVNGANYWENDALRNALAALLEDTQHSEHRCGDEDCPVKIAREILEGDKHG